MIFYIVGKKHTDNYNVYYCVTERNFNVLGRYTCTFISKEDFDVDTFVELHFSHKYKKWYYAKKN